MQRHAGPQGYRLKNPGVTYVQKTQNVIICLISVSLSNIFIQNIICMKLALYLIAKQFL